MAEPYYCTAEEVRTELGVTAEVLPDAQALKLILDAEDHIDMLLGFRVVYPETGRKVEQADVQSWQWDKLSRATVKLAALLYTQPDAINGPRFRTMSGPDFSGSNPLGATIGQAIMTLLNGSGLRRLTGRAGYRRNGPIGRDFARDIIGPAAE